MPDASTSEKEPTKKNRWLGKTPRSSRDIDSAIESCGAVIVEGKTTSGDHTTYKVKLEDGTRDTLTLIQGRDLKDTNPKVWYKLIKTLKNWGVVTLLAAGGATLIASQLGNFVK